MMHSAIIVIVLTTAVCLPFGDLKPPQNYDHIKLLIKKYTNKLRSRCSRYTIYIESATTNNCQMLMGG